jgi:hypothetical protein
MMLDRPFMNDSNRITLVYTSTNWEFRTIWVVVEEIKLSLEMLILDIRFSAISVENLPLSVGLNRGDKTQCQYNSSVQQ